MSFLTSKTFWKDSVERSVKTFAQTGYALIMSDSIGLLDVDWVAFASVSGLAALASLLTSIGSGRVGDTNSASLVVDVEE